MSLKLPFNRTLITLTVSFLCCSRVYAAPIDYSQWEHVLNGYVDSSGRVDYQGLKAQRAPLDDFINLQVAAADISGLTSNEQKAFWINAYNALTLRLIIDHYPLPFGDIRTINWGRPWSIQMKVAGKELTLGDIEHEILRKWDPLDPRIHFAINCASIGCPKLPHTHFDPQQLEAQLDAEARRFINDPEKVRLDRAANILYHSAIFDWFKDDFVNGHPGVLDYILQYLNQEDKDYISANKDKIRLRALKYDWGLNER